MKIMILGGRGYLGGLFLSRYSGAVSPDIDIADQQAVISVLEEHRPDVVINTAGKTGRPNIDWCEEHKPETIRSNVTGPLILLDECLRRNVRLVHIGSGCIYTGDNGGRGFAETDSANFAGSFYSRTKAWADQILGEFPVLILRLRMPFDGSTNPRNLIMKLAKYPRVLDVRNALTYLPDFLTTAQTLIERGRTGIYHVTNPGAVSPFEIMQMYKKFVQKDHVFERLTLEDLPDVARAGRSNCILNTDRLAAEGIALRPVQEALSEALEQIRTAM